MRKLMAIVVGVTLLVAGMAPLSSAKGGWVAHDLGTLGSSQAGAYGINERGDIVGGNGPGPFLLTKKGRVTILGDGGNAWAINRRGQIAGSLRVSDGVAHAFLWDDGVLTDLGTLEGGINSYAYGMNDKGQVVGFSNDGAGNHAFRWSAGVMTDIGPGVAYGINNRGQVVGDANQHAFLWADGVSTDLGTLGGSRSGAYGINDRGQVVGWAKADDTGYGDDGKRPVTWVQGQIRELDLPAGSVAAEPRDINEHGLIVGSIWDASGHAHPFVWDHDKLIELPIDGNSAGWAYAVNDGGDVVGSASSTPAVRSHVFLWTR